MMEEKEHKENVRPLADQDYSRRKNRRKFVRTILELAVLGVVAWLLVTVFVTMKSYEPYDHSSVVQGTEDTGFVALSYFGVDRVGDSATLMGVEQLRKHLAELKRQGYVTISQQDILDYYQKGTPLPPKALYLMFEDGRRDTAIFAQPILEDLNYRATMMSYAENFDTADMKFLQPDELKEMEGTSFWEMGTNGYRLYFINVFDRYDNFLGNIDPLQYAMIHNYMRRGYNHYLMDYIRDKYGVPKESWRHMKERLGYDYERMRDLYETRLGYMPRAHVLMHANTGKFGNNRDVSEVNERWIRELFPMNFNREGYCFNQRNSSLYDLTRMQPQPYWPVNHLLMRMASDINQPVEYVTGDARGKDLFDLRYGAGELVEESYTLTSLAGGHALAFLKGEGPYGDVRLSAGLEGNAFGTQQIFLRARWDLSGYISVELVNELLIVSECAGGQKKELYRGKVPEILGEKIPSEEEARKEAEVTEYQAFSRYAASPEMAKEYLSRSEKRKEEPAASVEEGAKPFEDIQSFHKRSNHQIRIDLQGNEISVWLDDKPAAEKLKVQRTEAGGIALGASWLGDAWSQRNLADDVYDGVFHRVIVQSNSGKEAADEQVLFTMEMHGLDKLKLRASEWWTTILGFFVNRL